MEDSVGNEGTEAKKVGDEDVRKTYEKPSLMEYGSIEILTRGHGSQCGDSVGGGTSYCGQAGERRGGHSR